VPAEKSGWTKNFLSGGKTTLSLSDDGNFDILYVDSTLNISSARADGATVDPIRFGDDEITVTVNYPGQTFEIYSFTRVGGGVLRLTYLQSRGAAAGFNNGTLMIATCSRIDIELIDAMIAADAAAKAAGRPK
jgi:hypothetical protein